VEEITNEANPDFMLSLARGLAIIEAFEDRPDGVTVADVAERTGLSRAAVRRALITLRILGYATNSGSIYRLTGRILRVGFSYLSSQPLSILAAPVLEDITNAIHESSSLSILDGDEILYLARSSTKRVMGIGLSVGSRLPAYCSSMGRVLLAHLPEDKLREYLAHVDLKPHTTRTITDPVVLEAELRKVRQQGYALVDEELEQGLRSIAVPVARREGQVVAAINSGVHTSRASAADLIDRILPALKRGSEMMQRSLA
jgi:IclR family transcriptional regulator, pca regulon regulatory protein